MAYGYIIVEMQISDPEQYKKYMVEAPAAVKAFGGEYLVRGGKTEVIEGDWQPARIAVLRFPSFDQAKAFHQDAHYTRVRGLRKDAVEFFNMILVEGVDAPIP